MKMCNRSLGVALALLCVAQPGSAQSTASVPVAASISASDKAQGAQAHPELLKQYGGAYPGKQADYVRRVGQRIAVQSGLSNAQSDFTVTLLNSPVDNAFAIPGGYVYVTRNLLALMNDEAELASVMGHEVGHVAARHAKSRNDRATGAGLLAGIIGAVAGNSKLGSLIGKGAGLGAQLYTLGYSRSQETEADALGIRYLAKAGYDPMAAPSILAGLAAQNTLDARIGGRTSNTPTLLSTHPDPASRVVRATEVAKATGYTRGVRNRDAFLAAIDGMTYGDDPSQGIVDGRVFRHPALKLAFTAPTGFSITNGTDALVVAGEGGQATFSGGAFAGDFDRYIAAAFAKLSPNATIDFGTPRRFQVNGIDAASATARANTQSGPVDVTVIAYAFDAKTAWQFVLITAAGSGTGPFGSLVGSMRRLSASEIAQIKPRIVRIVAVRPGDTMASLAGRMAYPSFQAERFRVLNALAPDAVLKPGQKVKLIVFG
jgi:predicted Zn-dependent protease